MSRRCKHENADHLMPGECLVRWDDIGRPQSVLVEQLRCLDCGAWLPLGPSSDGDERVGVEIRAAEIAIGNDRRALSTRFDFNGTEWEGWRGRETINLHVEFPDGAERDDEGVPLNLDSPKWSAGYLARCIAEHEEQEGG